MSRQQHPLLPEELMAYFDGELPAEQAAIAAKHLETCMECRQTMADAGRLSHEMAAWQIDEPTPGLSSAVLAETKRLGKKTRGTSPLSAWWGQRRMWVYGLAGGFAVLLFAVYIMTPSLLRSRQAANEDSKGFESNGFQVFDKSIEGPASTSGGEGAAQRGTSERMEPPRALSSAIPQPPPAGKEEQAGEAVTSPPSPDNAGPMIIRTVQLTLITKEFDKARPQIDAIVRSTGGYIEQLQVRGEIGSGRAISATLRVPADKLDVSLIELRKLGHLQHESQSSSDVSSQYVDLSARLKNARNTEQRFLALLRERTGSLKDVVEAEREISRVREEIERMDAQLKGLSKKVAYATVQIELMEEFRANLQQTLPSNRTRIGNAAVNGYKLAVETVVGFIMVILLYGPTILMLAIVLAVVALIAWRVQKRQLAKQA